MLGAIAGDVIGSAYEWNRVSSRDFTLFSPASRFTDDSVLTLAVASAILEGGTAGAPDYLKHVLEFARRWPNAGYGGNFRKWFRSDDPKPYNSWGNGSAMRASPVGFLFDSEHAVLSEAKRSADISHDHPEGVKGAQSVALAVFLARKGASKETIKSRIAQDFHYDLSRSIDDIQPHYSFDVSCQGSVPEAIIAFLESTDFESAVRNAIFLGGDADTQACIAGGIAEAFYGGVPAEIASEVQVRLEPEHVEVLRGYNDFPAGRLR
jgi:ADP-ribosylglycohydrolase